MRLGIDIGGTKISVGITDDTGNLLAKKKLYVARIQNLTDSIKTAVNELCSEIGSDRKEIASCGVGVPGTVSRDGKTLIKAPNISILPPNVVEEIENTLNIPTVLVQDSRAAAWGEYLCGGGVGAENIVCITLGTGIGTGLVLNKRIYNGSLGCAGEIGHIPVTEGGRACGCGKHGCLEKYAAGGGLDITATELLGTGKTASDLFDQANNGNELAKIEISKAVKLLGNAIVSVINLLSPDCILFSGGLSEQTVLYLEPIIEYVKKHCYSSGKIPRLEKAALGEDAPLIGAALMYTANQ